MTVLRQNHVIIFSVVHALMIGFSQDLAVQFVKLLLWNVKETIMIIESSKAL